MEEVVDFPKVPVTVITGFFGAGKTTFIKHVLTADHGKKIAVVQNEFSDEMGIESPMLVDSSGKVVPDIYELPNGCICCNVKDDFIYAIDTMIEQNRKFDYILVETTGFSDPEPVCEVFWVDDDVSKVRLDGIVTMVDAQNILDQLESREKQSEHGLGLGTEAAKQIACAQRVVINKIDLVSPEKLELVKAAISAINPVAPVILTEQSKVNLDAVLDIGGLDTSAFEDLKEKACTKEGCEHGHSHNHQHESAPPSNVAHGVMNVFVSVPNSELQSTGLEVAKVKSWLGEVLWERSCGHVYRSKGIFWTNRQDEFGAVTEQRYAWGMQGVGDLFEMRATEASIPDSCRFLFIGTDLDREKLEQGLRSCYK